jgi:hypothetical protein
MSDVDFEMGDSVVAFILFSVEDTNLPNLTG